MKNILQRIRSFEFDKNKNHLFGIKSAIVWGREDNITFPLLYIQKPRTMSREDFELILDHLDINIRKQ